MSIFFLDVKSQTHTAKHSRFFCSWFVSPFVYVLFLFLSLSLPPPHLLCCHPHATQVAKARRAHAWSTAAAAKAWSQSRSLTFTLGSTIVFIATPVLLAYIAREKNAQLMQLHTIMNEQTQNPFADAFDAAAASSSSSSSAAGGAPTGNPMAGSAQS
jgi:hypothetical protein